MSDGARILYQFKRNEEVTLRVSLATFKGRRFVDIRLHYLDAGGELRPTRKGVTITPELWDSFLAAISVATVELQEAGLWYPPGDCEDPSRKAAAGNEKGETPS